MHIQLIVKINIVVLCIHKRRRYYIILYQYIYSQVREELRAEIRYQREVSGRVQKHPDVTTKHGKLKSKRKNPPTTIYVDDLAALDSLSEV